MTAFINAGAVGAETMDAAREAAVALDKYAGIYSEEKVISIIGPTERYADVTMSRFNALYNPQAMFNGVEITEQEFNELVSKTIAIISGAKAMKPVIEQVY